MIFVETHPSALRPGPGAGKARKSCENSCSLKSQIIYVKLCQSGYPYRAGFFNTWKPTRLNEHIRHVHTARTTNTCVQSNRAGTHTTSHTAKQMKVVTNHPANKNQDSTSKCKLNTHLVIQENHVHPPRTKKKNAHSKRVAES